MRTSYKRQISLHLDWNFATMVRITMNTSRPLDSLYKFERSVNDLI